MDNSINLPPNPMMMLLKQIVDAVNAGQISSIAMIAVQPNGITSSHYVGEQRADINVGADILKQVLLRDMTQPKRSPIIRATMG